MSTSSSPGTIFDGLRVVDFSEGMAGPMASMVLADNGADVVKVEPPGGDAARTSPGFLMWNRAKRSVVLDLDDEADRSRAVELALTADVVLTAFPPGRAAELGLDHGSLSARRPDLVSCSISAFGLATRHEQPSMDEGVVAAKSGRTCGNDEVSGAHFRDRPVFIASPINSFGAAMLAVEGIAAALVARDRDGRGQLVETSLLDGANTATMRLAFERRDGGVVRAHERGLDSALVQRGVRLTFLTAECADGRYIQMCARQDHHFKNWLQALGLAHLLEEERFARAPMGLVSLDDADELEALLRERMRTRTQAEWMRIFMEDLDVGADPFLTFDEFLEHPQMLLNDRIAELEDPEHGPVTQIGPLAIFGETPTRITASAPALGQHQGELDALVARGAPSRPVPAPTWNDDPGAAPLAGVTILEVAQYLASPLAITLLAELGARVIKIEPPEGDSFRRVGLEFCHIGHGKESLAVDLKSEDGRAILHRLVESADVLVHNFRPGVPERLGMDLATLQAINPRLIYFYGGSYGSVGPQRHRAAFHSTPHALCGAGTLQAGEGNPPIDDSYPDPCAALAAAASIAMALYARHRLGVGQYVETTMLASAGYVHSERLTKYRDRPTLPGVDHEQRGHHALYRLYPTQQGWVFVGGTRAEHWPALARALGHPEWCEDERFANPAARLERDPALTAAIEAVLAAKDAATWERVLLDAGVPAAEVGESFEEFFVAEGLMEPAEYPGLPPYWRSKPRVRFSSSPSHEGPAPRVGEHTDALLAELGLDEATVADLHERGVVRSAS